MESNVPNVVGKTIESCTLCTGSCNKKIPTGKGNTLYVIPYDSEDDEILKNRGTVIREVACENGIDYVCNIYVRLMLESFATAAVTTAYASHLLGREVEEFETFKFKNVKIIAANNQCDVRVKQELADV
jgi:hypothetical protein